MRPTLSCWPDSVPTVVRAAPGVRVVSWSGLRELMGRSWTCFSSTVVEISEEAVLISWAPAETSTVSVWAPMVRTISRPRVWPVRSSVSGRFWVWKPGLVMVMA